MYGRMTPAAAAISMMAGTAATDPIEGKWRTESGATSGKALERSGSVLGGLICRKQSWSRMVSGSRR